MRLNKFLLASAVIVPTLAPSLTLTSCSQTWGYLNPISFGSIDQGDANDPYQAFRSQTNVYLDANGQDITKYLQSNFIIDQAKSSIYAYTSPVTKWYETKDDVSGDEEPKVLPVNSWQRLNDGWKTSSDGISTSVTLDDPDEDKPKGVKKTYTNNENFNLVSNINFTSTIASTISNYLTYGLQYQASQINVNDKKLKKDLNAAWGSQSSLLNLQKETGWINTGDEDQNRNFYEYIFASANSHSTGKTNSFLRPISANFNFESNYFPFPTYDVTTPAADDIDARINVSAKTKLLLMHDGTIKFCRAGIEGKTSELAYYTDVKDVKVNIPYKKTTNAAEWDSYPLTVKQYLFSSVPIVVDATNLSAKWVDPTKNDSFVPSDYFINDSETVNKAIGNSWEKISEFATGEAKSTIQKFSFDLTKAGESHRTFNIYEDPDPEKGTDPRIINKTMSGNSFVVLVSYVVNEYDSDKSLKARDKYFDEKEMDVPEELSDANLAKLNAVSINSIESIFPAYLLSISDNNLFKKAHKDIEDKDEGTTTKFGYIINSSTVSKYNNKLLNLLRRTSQEGMKPHASELSQESKDLLAFLGFMFASTADTLSTDFLSTDPWQN